MTTFAVLLTAVLIVVIVGPEKIASFATIYGSMHWRRWQDRRPYMRRKKYPNRELHDVIQGTDLPLRKSDVNVCLEELPELPQRRTSGRGCFDIRGKLRRLRLLNPKYVCCPGFKRVPGKSGCPVAMYTSIKNIPEVAKELGLNKFLEYASKVSVEKLLKGKGPFTLFAPSNEAFAKLPEETRKKMENQKWARYYLQYHVVEGKYIAENLTNGISLRSYDDEVLRVSTYGARKTLYVEGARVSNPNQGASNGIIHVIDQFLTPPRHTIMEALEQDENQRFTIFQNALASSSLGLTGQWTVFAPTDEAFKKLSNETLEILLNNNKCLKALVKNHLVRGLLFTRIDKTVNSLERNQLSLKRNALGEAMVNDKKISEEMAVRDGVIHVIDDLLLPTSAMSFSFLMKNLKLTEFAKFLKTSGIAQRLEEKGPYTIFAPTNEAFEKLSNETKHMFARSPEVLLKILEYHVVEGVVKTKDFVNDQTLTSWNKRNKLRINLFNYNIITVEGSWVKKRDIPSCNGIIHVIDEVLVPPMSNLLKILNTDPRLSIFRSLLTNTSVDEKLNGSDPFTIFAPSDEAFAKLSEDELEDILESNASVEAFVSIHIICGSWYSCSVTCRYRAWLEQWKPLPWRRRGWKYWWCNNEYLHSLKGKVIKFGKCDYSDVQINGIHMNAADISATNGVVHVINGVIISGRRGW